MNYRNGEPAETEPLEYFKLGRRIHRGIVACGQSDLNGVAGDVFYLWIQLGPAEVDTEVSRDQWLSVIDEAASIGVNWLVITVSGDAPARQHVGAILRWAHETYDMVVCLHSPDGRLDEEDAQLLRELPRESSYLLVDPNHEASFAGLRADGINIRLANPEIQESSARCEYPYKMIYMDTAGRLYTCGLVSGESEFFLGSAFEGGLEQIIHNPLLPHAVPVSQPSSADKNCSGCPPLVAKYLCQK